jgi:hypothetical protein
MKHSTWLALPTIAALLAWAIPRVCYAEQVVAIGGKCLDVPHGNPTNGTGLEIWQCGQSSPNQRWSFVGETIVGIGGKCLDVEAGRTEDGTRVQVWNCNGGANQHWKFVDGQLVGLGHKCMDVTGGSTDNGTPVVLWHCTGSANQKFVLLPSITTP